MMIRSLWTGATGMRAMQDNIDAISNDLSNVNTNGYKKRYLNFQDLFYQNLRAAGLQGGDANTNVPVGIQIGNGVKLAATTPVFTHGNPFETNVWSDMMINDNTSFFSVTMPDGREAYTRDGTFRVDQNGELRTTDGLPLNPPITGIPNGAVDPQVSLGGMVSYRDPNSGDMVEVGQVQLYNFVNPAGLEAYGQNLWLETESSGNANAGDPDTEGYGSIQGGWVEGSNVDAVTEMVNMISAQRAYEFNSKSIQTSDAMLQTVNGLKR